MLRARYRRILWFFGQVLAGVIWWDLFLPRIGLGAVARRNRPPRMRRIAVRFRALAIEMGGVMIKVGQFLSARLDVLPVEITTELSGLQDEVRPEKFEDIRAEIEREFDTSLDGLFCSFDPVPLASASIGQVHRACLRIGDPARDQAVVVKVQRPNIQAIVETDLAALRVVSGWIDRYPPVRRRMDTRALMSEFANTLNEEIDYLAEGKNAETFAANFAQRSDIYVPQVFWSRTTRRVLTLENIDAIKITDYAAIESAGVSRVEAASRLFGTYLQQIFEDRFFHADPHPGNLFILPAQSNDEAGSWKLVFVDFGMVGRLNESFKDGLREVLIAIGTQDAARLVKAYRQLDLLLPEADAELIQKASAEAFSRFWGRTAPDLASMGREEMAAFARKFSDILYDLPFQVPENFILLGRCLGILSGICSGLDPSFNLWTEVAPYAEKLVADERGSTAGFILREVGDTLRVVAGLPRRGDALLSRLEEGRLSVQTPEIRSGLARVERGLKRVAGAVVFAALFLGAVQFFLAGEAGLAIGAAAAALIALLLSLTNLF